MKAIAAVLAMKWMYNLRKALKQNDHFEILRCHAMYEEWQVRPEEPATSGWAKRAVDRELDGMF